MLCCRWRLVGDILVGASSDEPSDGFTTAARDTMLTVTGVDLRSIMFRYKFTFVAQVGSPQITERTHRDWELRYKDQDPFQNPRGRLKVGTFESRKSSDNRKNSRDWELLYTDQDPFQNPRGRLKVGSPQKAVYEVRDEQLPCGLSMDVLVRGQSIANSSLATKPIQAYTKLIP